DGGEMVLDRRLDIRDVEGDGEPAREGVEVGQVDLALARQLELALQPVRELADDHRGEGEDDEIDDLVRILDLEAVERLEEEEGRGQDAAHSREHRGRDA